MRTLHANFGKMQLKFNQREREREREEKRERERARELHQSIIYAELVHILSLGQTLAEQ